MSFGEGDLHGKVDELARKAEMYRRQLGGTQAALRRAQQRARDAQAEVDRLKDVNGALCAEINRQERRIRELEGILRDIWRSCRCFPKCPNRDLVTDDCEIEERFTRLAIDLDGGFWHPSCPYDKAVER